MIQSFLKNNSRLLSRPQKSIISAATIIMIMVAASRFLGLVRNRILAHYFSADGLAVYFAAFRLPEVIFEILVFGTLTSAFIPVFTSYFGRHKKKEAWRVAAISLNILLLLFLALAVFVFVLARPLYQLIVPGFSPDQLEKTVLLARILLLAQGFFLLSYFTTAVLESLRRFLLPAIAPLFYNLGIILGTIFLNKNFAISAPAIGAVFGAFLHFSVQVPLVFRLGFKPRKNLSLTHPGVKEIGHLAVPRMVELSFLQIFKSLELYLASIVSSAAYTYLTFASSLQLLPVSLFGASLAKASLPSLSYSASRPGKFKSIFLSSFNQILFLTLPFSVFLAVLRIPAVRLFFGTPRFSWTSTLETSFALSAFCLGIAPQSLIFLLNRAFYALHNPVIPMTISILSLLINAILGLVLVLLFGYPVWSLALVFSLARIFQMTLLLILLCRHSQKFRFSGLDFFLPFSKIFSASVFSGALMYFLLKILDRSAWDQRLSFLGKLGLALPTSFNLFALDTRYTLNLIIITFLVGLVGIVAYLFLAWLFRLKELFVFLRLLEKIEKLTPFPRRFDRKRESITIDNSSRSE
jgi:putative peptidoglycan lipid II flippase